MFWKFNKWLFRHFYYALDFSLPEVSCVDLKIVCQCVFCRLLRYTALCLGKKFEDENVKKGYQEFEITPWEGWLLSSVKDPYVIEDTVCALFN